MVVRVGFFVVLFLGACHASAPMMAHETRCVQDGPDAIAETNRFHSDLVLFDVCMPGMDGWDVARTLTRILLTMPPVLIERELP